MTILAQIPSSDTEGLLWAEAAAQKVAGGEFAASALSVIEPAQNEIDAFVFAALAADWASYSAEADKVNHERLKTMIENFPSGFRVYFSTLSNGECLPVGYTGWYPIAENVFDILNKNPGEIKHRGFMKAVPKSDYLYLFNYSVAPCLIGTDQSRQLVKDFAASISSIQKKGMAAVTVSPHGARVAEKFGMTCSGQMTHYGDIENVYTLRL